MVILYSFEIYLHDQNDVSPWQYKRLNSYALFHKTLFFKNVLEGLRQDLGILSEMWYYILLSVTYDLEVS